MDKHYIYKITITITIRILKQPLYNTVSNSQIEILLNIYARYFQAHTFQFSFYEDTKCVKGHAILMPAFNLWNEYVYVR